MGRTLMNDDPVKLEFCGLVRRNSVAPHVELQLELQWSHNLNSIELNHVEFEASECYDQYVRNGADLDTK